MPTRLLLLLSLLLLSCETFDPLERVPADPDSDGYVLDRPAQVGAKLTEGKVRITWEDVSGAETGYLIEQRLDDTEAYEEVARLEANTESWTSGIPRGLSAQYRISTLRETETGARASDPVESAVLLLFNPSALKTRLAIQSDYQTRLSHDGGGTLFGLSGYLRLYAQRYADGVPDGPEQVYFAPPASSTGYDYFDAVDVRPAAYFYEIRAGVDEHRSAPFRTNTVTPPPTWPDPLVIGAYTSIEYNQSALGFVYLSVFFPRPRLEPRYNIVLEDESGTERALTPSFPPFLGSEPVNVNFEVPLSHLDQSKSYRTVLITNSGERVSHTGAPLRYDASEGWWIISN